MVTYAFVNHGRWIVPCPNCNSADLLVLGTIRFTCRECHQTHDIVSPMDMEEINAALRLRLKVENRNWMPGETVKTLRLENILHGVEDM